MPFCAQPPALSPRHQTGYFFNREARAPLSCSHLKAGLSWKITVLSPTNHRLLWCHHQGTGSKCLALVWVVGFGRGPAPTGSQQPSPKEAFIFVLPFLNILFPLNHYHCKQMVGLLYN